MTKPGFSFLGSFYILLRMHVCFVVFVLFFQYLAERLAGKNVSKMTYFLLGGT